MKHITTQQLDLLFQSYPISRRLRSNLRYNLDVIDWDEREFVTLTDKQGDEGVFISEVSGAELMYYSLRKRNANQAGRIEAIICDICATWQSGPRSATITFQKTKATATFLVCADLACCDHVRDKTEAAIVSRSQLREHITPEDRIRRLQLNLGRMLI